MSHIVQQFLLHTLTGPFLIGAVFYALRYWMKRNTKVSKWVSPDPVHLLVLSAALAVVLTLPREAYDYAFGRQTLVKTFTDQVSWLVMAAAGVWLIYRLACQEASK